MSTLEKLNKTDLTKLVEPIVQDAPNDALHESFTFRAPTVDDLEAVVDFCNLTWGALVGAEEFTVEDLRRDWQEPSLNPETDLRLLLDGDGKVIAYVEFYLREPYVRNFTWSQILPEWRIPEIGSLVYGWVESRAQEAIEKAPEGARVSLLALTIGKDADTGHLLGSRGYQLIRRFYRMVIEMDAPPPSPVWPLGLDEIQQITIRTMKPGEELAVIEAVRDSFRDHWGYVERSLETELEFWQHRMSEPDYDPSLWFLAEDQGKIAGISLCSPNFTGHPDMAWLSTLGVLRPWRKKGLATALLYHTFGEFYRRGKRKVGLGVDAQSLTGATRLYEKVGMKVALEFHDFELELRPGVELGTLELEGS